jgi:hypothetical protein
MITIKVRINDTFYDYKEVEINVDEQVEAKTLEGEDITVELKEKFFEHQEVEVDVDEIVEVDIEEKDLLGALCESFETQCDNNCTTCVLWNYDNLLTSVKNNKEMKVECFSSEVNNEQI